MIKENLTYINTVLIVLILVLGFTGHSVVKFGAVASTATTYNDINLDSTNGIGTASLAQNGNTIIASSTTGALITAQTLNAGTITATTSATTAALTATGAVSLTGTTTISGATAISQTTSSTLKIGLNTSGIGVGCLVLGDSGGATSTPVYITATGATISATTTKPTICK